MTFSTFLIVLIVAYAIYYGIIIFLDLSKKNISEEKEQNYSNIEIDEDEFKAVVQNELLFAFDSFELSEDAKGILDKLIPVIEDVPDTKLKIIGHTDNIGGKSYNDNLSLNRAKSVASYLSAGGIDRNSIIEQGKGFSQPVADNTTEQGRAKNRRVEIFINNEIKQ